MIRALLRFALLGGFTAWALDRLLAGRRAGGPPPSMDMVVVIDAPIEAVWAVVSDIPRQPEWMHEMKEVRIETPGPTRAGTRGNATVRIFGISVSDPVEVTEFEPPHRFAIAHEGLFTGGGVITLEPNADRSATTVRWQETLVPPVLPDLVAALQAPVLREIFQADLLHLKEIVEGELAGGAGRADADLATATGPS